MNRAALLALLAHWRRNPLQLFTLVAGLALATALWSGVQAINAEARASYDAAAQALGQGQYARITRTDGAAMNAGDFAALRRAGWRVSPVIEGRLAVGEASVRLLGIEPLTAPQGLGSVDIDAQTLSDFVLQDTLFAAPDLVVRLQAEGFTARVVEGTVPGTVIADIATAQRILRRPGAIDTMILTHPAPVTALPGGLSISQPQDSGDVARLTDSFHLNLTAFGFLAFAVGTFIVHGAIGLAFEQRRSVFRTLRALGLPLLRLIGLLAVELMALALVAGALGVVLGYLIAAALLPDVAATLRGLYGADVSGTLAIRPAWWLSGLAIAFLGTAVAASGALWQLSRLPILAGGQSRAWSRLSGRMIFVQGGAAVLLLLLAAGLAIFGTGLTAGFALLGALLVGAALALPAILSGLLSLGARWARGPLTEWFWADTRQQLRGLSLALMALLLAMAANVGVSTMVSSFRLTFAGFLDQRLASELYVQTTDEAAAAEFVTFATPRADAILPLMSVSQRLAGQHGEVFAARDHRTYSDNWKFIAALPDPWAVLHTGTGVLLNEQTARRADLGAGDTLEIDGEHYVIAGVYSDYGNPEGQAILGEAEFRDRFPDVVATRFGLRTADPGGLRRDLTEDLGLSPDAIVDQAALKALSMEIFERTFTVTAALNVLTLTVAGFAMLMSLLTLAGMRLPQLAPVWALGLTRRRMRGLELLRALMLAALTALVALPLGLALAWALLSVVNVEAFGWKLPMYLFPADYARLGLLALVAAVAAAWWPARQLSRTPPSQLLKVFSNER